MARYRSEHFRPRAAGAKSSHFIVQQLGVSIMAGATKEVVIDDANEAALRRFEEGLARSIKQYKAGDVESFDDKDEFIRTLIE